MGTYTTNYNLFMPSIGEQGWGDLVNGNFSTLDSTIKGLSNRIAAVESEVNGNLSCTSVVTSGTITSTGKITANGGIGCKDLTATSISNSGNMTNTGTLTSTGMIYANGGINADLSSCFGFTSESGVIGAIKLSTATTLMDAKWNVNGYYEGHGPYTYTYKENPISNDVVFTVYARGNGMYSASATANLKINSTVVCSATSGNNNAVSKTYSTTLKDGDVIVVQGSFSANGATGATVSMKCEGFLTN